MGSMTALLDMKKHTKHDNNTVKRIIINYQYLSSVFQDDGREPE